MLLVTAVKCLFPVFILLTLVVVFGLLYLSLVVVILTLLSSLVVVIVFPWMLMLVVVVIYRLIVSLLLVVHHFGCYDHWLVFMSVVVLVVVSLVFSVATGGMSSRIKGFEKHEN